MSACLYLSLSLSLSLSLFEDLKHKNIFLLGDLAPAGIKKKQRRENDNKTKLDLYRTAFIIAFRKCKEVLKVL